MAMGNGEELCEAPAGSSSSAQSVQKSIRNTVVNSSNKLMATFTRFVHTVFACYPKVHRKQSTSDDCVAEEEKAAIVEEKREKELLDLPNELLTLVFAKCEASTVMKLRKVNHRCCNVVDSSSRLARVSVVGGLKVLPYTGPLSGKQIILKRITRPEKEIAVNYDGMRNIFRRITICHKLKVLSLHTDGQLLSLLNNAAFRIMESLVIDRLAVENSELLKVFLKKVQPTRELLLNTADPAFSNSVCPQLIVDSTARTITIGDKVLSEFLDDDFLVSLVTSDALLRRAVSLPPTAITHKGISAAAEAFHTHCVDIRSEVCQDHYNPIVHVVVLISGTDCIVADEVCIPLHMRDQCKVWRDPMTSSKDFCVEVRVDLMNLRMNVSYPSLTPPR